MTTTKEIKLSTPWGMADQVTDIGRGILKVSTPGHGGYFVPPAIYKTMPAGLRCNAYGGGTWFEEDCEWALVALAFPNLFPFSALEIARRCVPQYSDTYARAKEWLNAHCN